MLDLYLIRHAESDLNKAGNIIGGRSSDTPLSSTGIQQSIVLGARLKEDGIEVR